jgi:hypothetical protein
LTTLVSSTSPFWWDYPFLKQITACKTAVFVSAKFPNTAMKFFSAQNFFYLVSNNREFLDEAIIILKVYTKIGPWYYLYFCAGCWKKCFNCLDKKTTGAHTETESIDFNIKVLKQNFPYNIGSLYSLYAKLCCFKILFIVTHFGPHFSNLDVRR